MGRGRQGVGRRGCVCGGARAGLRAAIVARWGSKRYELEGDLSMRGRKGAVDAGRLHRDPTASPSSGPARGVYVGRRDSAMQGYKERSGTVGLSRR
jgi:hypothetical protein